MASTSRATLSMPSWSRFVTGGATSRCGAVQIRHALCEALGLTDEELPFAGELIQVLPDHQEWQGAAERVLHSFALSILVPNAHYQARVAGAINDHHLGTRRLLSGRQRHCARRRVFGPPAAGRPARGQGRAVRGVARRRTESGVPPVHVRPDLEVFRASACGDDERSSEVTLMVATRRTTDRGSTIAPLCSRLVQRAEIDALLRQAKLLHDQLSNPRLRAGQTVTVASCRRSARRVECSSSSRRTSSERPRLAGIGQGHLQPGVWRSSRLEAAEARGSSSRQPLAVADDELSMPSESAQRCGRSGAGAARQRSQP